MLLAALLAAPAFAERIEGVVRVIDGDTFDVGATRVRLHGVDAAEDDQTCVTGGAQWPCGEWVTGRARDLFEGRPAVCERVDTDRYGRAVARCAVDLATIAEAKEGEGGVEAWADMGAEVVGRGLAVAFRRYSEDYVEAEALARAKAVGVFAGAMEEPAAYRAERRAAGPGRTPPDSACAIKGNVSANGRIFHAPGGAFYERTAIDEAEGERWFCSPEEAVEAGWRASRR